ncbi:MAG TPA: ATP-binding protein, partial [Solirubrobacterales bacterium]|nr:ATP-binding protein [Solirubrobacterales bacterium]
HDFRRPLVAIRGFAELVLEERELPEEKRREFMQTVIAESDALAALADETQLITQIETGQVAFRWSQVDLGPFILQAVPLGMTEHSVLLDVPPQFPRIVADADRLRRVLTNLISNAEKYSPPGSSIKIRCRQRGEDHVVIEVIDHGLGIPKDQVGNLFQKFSRVHTDAHLQIQGSGLGLYICRLIVEGHGGQIWVESEIGQGSTFGFVLPRDARTVVGTSAPAASSRSVAVRPQRG